MRKFSIFGIALLIGSAAMTSLASAEPLTLTVDNTFASGRVFMEQGFILTSHADAEPEAIVCKDGWCFDLWHANTGQTAYHETDYIGSKDWHFDATTIQTNLGFFEVAGKDVWRARVMISYPVTSKCVGNGYADVMRGGYNTEVYKGEAACTIPLVWDLSASLKGQVSYDTTRKLTGAGYDLGVQTQINGVDVRAFVKGYAHLSDETAPFHDKANGSIVGITFSHTFDLSSL
jgi:hypothetical protein